MFYNLHIMFEHLWQFQVEVEYYSVVYFDCVTVFEAMLHKTSVKGGAHLHRIDMLGIYMCGSPATDFGCLDPRMIHQVTMDG